MSREDKYFQFPIGLLHTGKSILDVTAEEKQSQLIKVINYSLVHFAVKGEEETDNEEMRAEIGNLEASDDDVPICWAAKRLGVVLKAPLDEVRKCYRKSAAIRFGRTLVRLRTDLLWEAMESWHWREFAILCGVYAGIGDQQFARITQKRIRALAHGFSSQDECERHKLEFNLTDRQIGYTIAELERRNFFCRASPNHRDFFYSHRISAGELSAELSKHARPPKVNHRQRTAELRKKAEFMATAKQARRDLGSDRQTDKTKQKGPTR